MRQTNKFGINPTEKFNETVNNAAQQKKESGHNTSSEHPPIDGSQENRDVILNAINHIIDITAAEINETNKLQ